MLRKVTASTILHYNPYMKFFLQDPHRIKNLIQILCLINIFFVYRFLFLQELNLEEAVAFVRKPHMGKRKRPFCGIVTPLDGPSATLGKRARPDSFLEDCISVSSLPGNDFS